MEVRTFWCKNNGIFEIYDMSARTRGVEPVQIFFRQERRGQFFAIFCGRPLLTASKRFFGLKFKKKNTQQHYKAKPILNFFETIFP